MVLSPPVRDRFEMLNRDESVWPDPRHVGGLGERVGGLEAVRRDRLFSRIFQGRGEFERHQVCPCNYRVGVGVASGVRLYGGVVVKRAFYEVFFLGVRRLFRRNDADLDISKYLATQPIG